MDKHLCKSKRPEIKLRQPLTLEAGTYAGVEVSPVEDILRRKAAAPTPLIDPQLGVEDVALDMDPTDEDSMLLTRFTPELEAAVLARNKRWLLWSQLKVHTFTKSGTSTYQDPVTKLYTSRPALSCSGFGETECPYTDLRTEDNTYYTHGQKAGTDVAVLSHKCVICLKLCGVAGHAQRKAAFGSPETRAQERAHAGKCGIGSCQSDKSGTDLFCKDHLKKIHDSRQSNTRTIL